MRYACRAAVVAALTANTDLSGVQVEHCWPGDQQKPESIWLNPTEGLDVTVPVFHGEPSALNPITIDDKFTIPIEIMVTNAGKTPAEAEARVDALRLEVIETFCANPGLSQLTAPSGWRIIEAVVGAMDGPGTARGDNGAQSYASVALNLWTRKTPT